MLPGELAAIRATQLDYLPDSCYIWSSSGSPTGYGGDTITWSASASSVACRRSTLREDELRIIADKVGNRMPYKLTLPYGTAISEVNRVSFGETSGSYNYQVISAPVPSWQTAVRCIVVEIENP